MGMLSSKPMNPILFFLWGLKLLGSPNLKQKSLSVLSWPCKLKGHSINPSPISQPAWCVFAWTTKRPTLIAHIPRKIDPLVQVS